LEVTINSLSDVQQEADIVVNNTELQPHFDKSYKKYQSKIELKGFRKGKVPLPLIKKMYGEAIEHDTLDAVANELFRSVMEERNIHPIGTPTIHNMDFKRGEHFRFKIGYEVTPTFELKKYKGLTVEKPVHKVTDEEIDAEILRMRRINSSTSDAPKVTDTEFVVTADAQELDETGTPLIGKKSPGAKFQLYDDALVKEIQDALLNAEVGGVYRANWEGKHGDHSHKMNLEMTVTKVEKVTLPPFDDELVKKVTGEKVTSAEEYQKTLREDIERYWGEQSERMLDEALKAEIVRQHEFTAPETLVNGLLDAYLEEMKGRYKDKKLPKDFDEKKYREENHAYAVFQAKWLLLRDKIVDAEKLSVTEEEIDKLAETESQATGIPKDRLLQYYKSSGSPEERMLSGKLMTMLKQNAMITERAITANA
jgi:trigger factor